MLPLEVPEQVGAEERTGSENSAGPGHRRRLGDAAAGRVVGVEQLGQEARDAGGQDVDRDAGDDVVDAEGHRGHRVQQAAERAERHPTDAAAAQPHW